MLKFATLFVSLVLAAWGQGHTPPSVIYTSSDPTGNACGYSQIRVNNTSGAIYVCVAGIYQAASGETGGTGTPWATTSLGTLAAGTTPLDVTAGNQIFTATLGGNIVFTITGSNDASFMMDLTQDATGGRTVSCGTGFTSCGAMDPTATTGHCLQTFNWDAIAATAKPAGSMVCLSAVPGFVVPGSPNWYFRVPSTPPTAGNCGNWQSVGGYIQLSDAGSPCGSGGSGIGTIFSNNLSNTALATGPITDYNWVGYTTTTPFSTTYAARAAHMPTAATCQNLTVTTSGTQPASGSLVFTVMKNGATTALTVTFPAGQTATTKTDFVDTVAYLQSDTISMQIVNNATAGGATIYDWNFQCK